MGVGLNLTGKLAEAEELEPWFNKVWDWLQERFPGLATGASLGQGPYDEHPKVLLHFHPAADPVKIWFPEEKIVHVSADTVSAGPGYHLFLCDMLWALSGQFGIGWDPETDDGQSNPTFFSGDAEQAYYEMFSWLGSMAASALMMADSGSFYMSMPPSYRFFASAPLITPMGPRDTNWLKEVSKNPGAGADVFPWLKADAGAEFLLNKAIAHMWTDVRWCPPIGDGDEALIRTVLALLDLAFKIDPNLNFPFKEWSELNSYLQIEDELAVQIKNKAASMPKGPLIGYRRNEVRSVLDQGWSVLHPGSLSESASYDPATHNNTWQFSSPDRLIWFTTYPTYGDSEGNIMPVNEAVLELDELQSNIGQFVEESTEGKIWRRSFISGGEGQAYRFSSIFLVPGRLAMSHIFSERKEDQDFARKFFAAVDNSAGASSRYLEQPRYPRVDLVAVG